MTSRDFCFWLQGYFELCMASPDGCRVNMNADQLDMVKRHLALVFKHEIDPSMGPPTHQAALDAVHALTPNTEKPSRGSRVRAPTARR